jgi:hypothetical protein
MVTRKKEGMRQTEAMLKRQERASDGRQAMEQYEAEVRATQEKTERLRALRLAKAAEKLDEEVTV